MAVIGVSGEELVLHLPPQQKFLGFHGDLRAPLSSVRSVRVTDNPWMTLRGRRMAGTAMRGVAAIGTWLHSGGRYDYCVLRREDQAVVVDLATGRFDRWVVGVKDDAVGLAERIAAAAGIATGP